mmetsp:Transcript_9303/g.13813  ORF Transcript_9303/g.13813 Transcript_9303/m.13813 type:complete len:540 (-) Transcript_9303:118-1737(-)
MPFKMFFDEEVDDDHQGEIVEKEGTKDDAPNSEHDDDDEEEEEDDGDEEDDDDTASLSAPLEFESEDDMDGMMEEEEDDNNKEFLNSDGTGTAKRLVVNQTPATESAKAAHGDTAHISQKQNKTEDHPEEDAEKEKCVPSATNENYTRQANDEDAVVAIDAQNDDNGGDEVDEHSISNIDIDDDDFLKDITEEDDPPHHYPKPEENSRGIKFNKPPAFQKAPRQPKKKHELLKTGTIVKVASRTGPGENLPGGVARITEVHVDKEKDTILYDVAYVLGGREKDVGAEYVTEDKKEEAPRKRKKREIFKPQLEEQKEAIQKKLKGGHSKSQKDQLKQLYQASKQLRPPTATATKATDEYKPLSTSSSASPIVSSTMVSPDHKQKQRKRQPSTLAKKRKAAKSLSYMTPIIHDEEDNDDCGYDEPPPYHHQYNHHQHFDPHYHSRHYQAEHAKRVELFLLQCNLGQYASRFARLGYANNMNILMERVSMNDLAFFENLAEQVKFTPGHAMRFYAILSQSSKQRSMLETNLSYMHSGSTVWC